MEAGRPGPAALYRFFDARGVLLYAGKTQNFGRRWNDHASRPWWPQVAKATVEIHPSWDAAGRAESIAIAIEHPVYNQPLPAQAAALFATELIAMLGRGQVPGGNEILLSILTDLHSALTEALRQP